MEKTVCNNDLIITRLKSDYLQVNYPGSVKPSYGGCQSWFEKAEGGDIIKKQGCGLIAMSDLLIYLAGKNVGYSSGLIKSFSLEAPLNYNNYRNFVLAFNNKYVNLKICKNFDLRIFRHKILSIHTNSIDGKMGKILNNYFKENNIDLKAKWGLTDNSVYSDGNWFEKGIRKRRIKDMLSNDIPAIISVGPSLFGKMNGINCYEMHKEPGAVSYLFTGQKIVNHYFTVTAVIENKAKKGSGEFEPVMYEISSWGKKYYVSESEIKRFSRYNSSLFTNVLYIEKQK